MTTRAVVAPEPCGPERLQLVELPTPVPGPGQARVRVDYAGVNFIDVYHRTGLYRCRPRSASAGGRGRDRGGRRRRRPRRPATTWRGPASAARTRPTRSRPPIAWCRCPTASTTSRRRADAAGPDRALPDALDVPAGVRPHRACSTPPPAGSASCSRSWRAPPAPRDRHGLDRGQGRARRAAGCAHAIRYDREDFVAAIRRSPTAAASTSSTTRSARPRSGGLDCLRPRGMMVLFGQSSARSTARPARAQHQGLAVRDPSDPGALHPAPRASCWPAPPTCSARSPVAS